MTSIDVSVIITLHREAKYVARTLASLSDAATFARQRGITVELVAVLDRADDATKQAWQNARPNCFDNVQSIEVDNGSLGLSRNNGCAVANGELFDLIDGDDLISYNWIAYAFEAARQLGPTAALVPRFSFGFGADYYSVEYFSQDVSSTIGIVTGHPYTMKICASRTLFAACPYAEVSLTTGYAYEDWHFNCNATALGYRFFVVDGTALFYRQRANSLYRQSMRTSTGQIPPSPLFQPRTFLNVFADDAERIGLRREHTRPVAIGTGILDDPVYRDVFARANAIDPAVEIGRFRWKSRGNFTNQLHDEAGLTYYRACEAVGVHPYDLVFLLPGGMPNGRQCPVVRAMQVLAQHNPQARILAFLDQPWIRDREPPPLPGSATLVDLHVLGSSLSAEQRDVLCLKLLQACTPAAPLHCSPSDFAQRFFRRFGVLLADRYITCYRPPDAKRTWNGVTFTDPRGFEFVSEHIGLIDRIIAFDQETVEADRYRLPGLDHKWHLDAETGNRTLPGRQHG